MTQIEVPFENETLIIHPKDKILLDLWKWSVNDKGYVVRRTSHRHPKTGKPVGTQKFFHREVLKYIGPLTIDHIDGNPLNNHPDNLEIVPLSVNIARKNYGFDNVPMCEMDIDCKNLATTVVTAFDEDTPSCSVCKDEWDN